MKFFVGQDIRVKKGFYENRFGRIIEKCNDGKRPYYMVELPEFHKNFYSKTDPQVVLQKVFRCFYSHELEMWIPANYKNNFDYFQALIFITDIKKELSEYRRQKKKCRLSINYWTCVMFYKYWPEVYNMHTVDIVMQNNLMPKSEYFYRLDVIE